MKYIVLFAALFAVALARPGSDVEIVKQDSDVQPDHYSYNYATSDGTSANEEGHLENAGSEHEGIAVKGAFSFVGDDKNTYTVTYVADENGFQPKGAHLPVAPEALH